MQHLVRMIHSKVGTNVSAGGHYRPMWSFKNYHGERVPEDMRELVIECWDPEPNSRPGAAYLNSQDLYGVFG